MQIFFSYKIKDGGRGYLKDKVELDDVSITMKVNAECTENIKYNVFLKWIQLCIYQF